jgi:hypothetical protein
MMREERGDAPRGEATRREDNCGVILGYKNIFQSLMMMIADS